MKKLILITATLTMVLTATTAPVALAQTEPTSYVGYITSISGNSVLVEEDPQDPVLGGAGSNKGYFSVTGETEILRLVGGDAVAPATFEELDDWAVGVSHLFGAYLGILPSQGRSRKHLDLGGCRRGACVQHPRGVRLRWGLALLQKTKSFVGCLEKKSREDKEHRDLTHIGLGCSHSCWLCWE